MAAVWMVAVVGAFVGNRVVLGVGLVLAGAASVAALKLQMEAHSESPRRSSGGRSARPAARSPRVAAAKHSEGRLELYTERAIGDNVELVTTVREALIEHHFSKMTGWTDESGAEHFRIDLDRHSFQRHDAAVTYLVPWVNQVRPLAGSSIVEIGCGTGSSTAAFAAFAEIVHGYDISPSSIAAAEVRLEAHGLADRVSLVMSPPDQLLATIEAQHASAPVDVVLLYALLEHQTIDERIETLRLARRILKPGGAIVVIETPNRLTYFDRHTSQMPFFHMLPVRSPTALRRPVATHDVRREHRRPPAARAGRSGAAGADDPVGTKRQLPRLRGRPRRRQRPHPVEWSASQPDEVATGAARGAAVARLPAQH